MIKSINAAKKSFTFDTGFEVIEVPFSQIQKSEGWKNDKIIAIRFIDEDGDHTTSFARNSFLENISHHLAHQRAKPEDYEQDVLAYKLYRLLDGEKEEDIDAEIENVHTQRVILEDRKTAHKKAENKVLIDFMEKKKKVFERTAVQNKLSRLLVDIIEYVRIVEAYEKEGAVGRIRDDLAARDEMLDIWEMFQAANQEILKNDIALAESNKYLGFNREIAEQDRISLDIAKTPEDAEKFRAGIATAERMIAKYQDEVDSSRAQIDLLKAKRVDVEKSLIAKIMEMRIAAQAEFEELKAQFEKMPDFPELGDKPDNMPVMDFVISKEMKKMINAAKDESIPEVSLKNMTPELAKSALESKLAKTRKDL